MAQVTIAVTTQLMCALEDILFCIQCPVFPYLQSFKVGEYN